MKNIFQPVVNKKRIRIKKPPVLANNFLEEVQMYYLDYCLFSNNLTNFQVSSWLFENLCKILRLESHMLEFIIIIHVIAYICGA